MLLQVLRTTLLWKIASQHRVMIFRLGARLVLIGSCLLLSTVKSLSSHLTARRSLAKIEALAHEYVDKTTVWMFVGSACPSTLLTIRASPGLSRQGQQCGCPADPSTLLTIRASPELS